MSYHLVNVMSVINDNRTLADGVCAPVVINAQDYYAFGSVMPGRTYTATGSSNHRYGFGSHENDDEVSGIENHLDFGNYGYNTRHGRR